MPKKGTKRILSVNRLFAYEGQHVTNDNVNGLGLPAELVKARLEDGSLSERYVDEDAPEAAAAEAAKKKS